MLTDPQQVSIDPRDRTRGASGTGRRAAIGASVVGVLAAWGVLAIVPERDEVRPVPSRTRSVEFEAHATAPAAPRSAQPHRPPPPRLAPALMPAPAPRPAPQPAVQIPVPSQPRIESVAEAEPALTPTELAPARTAPDPASVGSRPEAELQAQWRREAPDPAWSAEVSEYLRETSTAAGLDASVVRSADCAATLCRVQLRFPNMDQAAAFEQAAQNPDLDYQSVPQQDGDGFRVDEFRGGPGEKA